MPERLELFGRTSWVFGGQGTAREDVVGLSVRPAGSSNWCFTGDVVWIEDSAADQVRTNYRAGDTGTLLRVQMVTSF